MFNERRYAIERMLSTQSFVGYEELAARFPDVSVMTLRRDIEALEKRRLCVKIRGGARSLLTDTGVSDGTVTKRMQEHKASKDALARQAAAYLEVGRSVFLDSGSTLQHITGYVPNERFSFVTTSPQLALDLCRIGLPTVNLVGGLLDADNLTTSGLQAMRYLEEINIDTALLAPSGFSDGGALTVGNYAECELKRTVVNKARQVIVLLEGSKIGKAMPFTFCELRQVDVLLTDRPLPELLTEEAKKAGTEVILIPTP